MKMKAENKTATNFFGSILLLCSYESSQGHDHNSQGKYLVVALNDSSV